MPNLQSKRVFLAGLLLATLSFCAIGQAAPTNVVIKPHAFKPDHLTIPANTRVRIMVANKSNLPAEFEGKDFTVEKVIPGGTTLPVFVGPLEAGTYHFFNDFNSSVTGTLTVK